MTFRARPYFDYFFRPTRRSLYERCVRTLLRSCSGYPLFAISPFNPATFSDAKNQLPKANCRKSARLQMSNMQRVDNNDQEMVRDIQADKSDRESELTNETGLEKEWI